MTELTKEKKVRSPRKGKKKEGYFGVEQDNAVYTFVDPNTPQREKDRVYSKYLYPAFKKIIESLIRKYNLTVPDEHFDDTVHETMFHLTTKLANFDRTKGFKVFSYCSVVCKRHLMLRRQSKIRYLQTNLSYETLYNYGEDDERIEDFDEENFINLDILNDKIMQDMSSQIVQMLIEPEKYKLRDNEIKVGYGLLSFFDSWEKYVGIEDKPKFNKFIFLSHIREETLLGTSEIRTAMKKFKKLYFDIKREELNDEKYEFDY